MTLKITSHDSEWQPKYFAVITGLFCGLYMITMAIMPKMIDLYGLIMPAGTIVFPLCAILTDILTEIYGFNRARQAVWTALICTILFALFAQLAIVLPTAAFWPHQDAFEILMAQSPRFAVAGCIAWVVGELSNSFVLSRLKILQDAKWMPMRFTVSTAVGQLLDSAVFAGVAFTGTMPPSKVVAIVLSIWAFKVAYEIIALPISIPITKWVKSREGVEHFDQQKLKII